MAYNPPIGSIYHLYTTYILPSGGLYATYHLLWEPKTRKTTIDGRSCRVVATRLYQNGGGEPLSGKAGEMVVFFGKNLGKLIPLQWAGRKRNQLKKMNPKFATLRDHLT